MKANPFVLVASLIASVVAALVTLYMTNEDFRNKVNAAWESVKSTISGVVNAIMVFLKQTVPNGIESLTNAFNNMRNSIATTIGNVYSTIVNGIGNAINWIRNLPSQAFSWGADMISGFVDGIKSMISRVGDAVKSVANTITSFLHFSRPDEGPLRDYETWMPDFLQGLARGIDANAWRVEGAVSRLTDDMQLDMSAAFSPAVGVSGTGHSGAFSGGSASYGDIYITINGAQYSSEESLAEALAQKLQFLTDRKAAAYA